MTIVDILLRIAMAIVIGGFIGYEREMRHRPAGFITHILVCVGACVVSLIQMQMMYDTIILLEHNPELANSLKVDMGRIVAQVIPGIGFLGAGTIILDKGRRLVKGLTTATTILVVACIGLAIGLGYYAIAIIAGLSIIFIIVVLKRIESKAMNKKFMVILEVTYYNKDKDFVEKTARYFRKNRVEVRDIQFRKSDIEDMNICRFALFFGIRGNRGAVMEALAENDMVVSLSEK